LPRREGGPLERQQRHQCWRAYEQAQHKQHELYRVVYRPWARLYTAYHQFLFGQQEAQQ
jgi:hypothetical protein